MARTWMDMHRLRRLHDSQYIMKNPFTNENSNLSNIFHNNIHRKKVESLKVRSTEEFLCQFAWLPCRFFRGRRQGRQPLNILESSPFEVVPNCWHAKRWSQTPTKRWCIGLTLDDMQSESVESVSQELYVTLYDVHLYIAAIASSKNFDAVSSNVSISLSHLPRSAHLPRRLPEAVEVNGNEGNSKTMGLKHDFLPHELWMTC